ncbi:MAG: leucine-rich repeat protein [Bacteroidaceae bacterium]|nr:leucine-rich repeat protein [Bacteroidaceae bacterium]
MKKTLQKLLVTVVCLLCSIGVYAYDFEVDGIYYNILNETDKTIEVTYKDTGYNSYSGDIVLQETVSYNDELYYIVKIGDRAFSKCDALYTVTLPNNVSNLGIGVFHNSNNLTEIHASNGVSTNSSQIFYNCTSLKSVVIDNNTTIINDEVFRGCSSLNKITIPQNITNLGEYAIAGCSGLIEIKVEAINPPYAESNTFNVIDKSIPVYVPAESVEAYKQAEYWSEFTNIVAIDEDNNSLVAEKVEVVKVDDVMKQDEISLPISLINTTEIAGLQCDIFLPDGLTPIMQGDKYDIVLSSRAEGFDVTAKLRNDGALRVVIVNTALDLISGNDGELFTIKLMPNEQYSTDDHIAIRNIVMTGSDYAEYEASDVVISCTIKESITGDSNCDKKVNVTDLSQMANYVAGNELGVFDADGADANQDGQVDSADIDTVSDVVVKASKAEAQNNTEVTEATENRLEADAIEIVKMNGVVVTNPISLPIALTNTATITAIQCDITVPAGLTLVENDGVADIILSERLGESHVVKSAWLDNGALRVLIYSPTAEGIEGESGTLFTLQLQPNESYQADATIEVKNITIASTDAVEYNAMPLSISCTVKESYKGDVNRDGKVNVTDVIVTIGKVLNVYDGEFDTVAADIDQDGEITIVDAVGIINLVLDEGDTPSQARMQDEYAQGELTMQDVKMSRGETKDLVIGLTNEAPYTAFQMDVTLPAGLNIEHIALSGRADGHTLQWQVQADGSVRIVGYALDNAAITGNDGALLTLTVSSDSQFETGEVVVSNAIFSTRQLVSHRMERMTVKVSNITSLNDVVTATRIYAADHKVVVDSSVAQEVAISTIDGMVQRVALQAGRNEIPLQQGVYIVAVDAEVKKVVIR